MRNSLIMIVLAAAQLCTGQTAASGGARPAVAVKFLTLFEQLRTAEQQQNQGRRQAVAFQLSDSEINDYLRYSLLATPRPGLESVRVKVFALNYISTYTIVDFDAIERWHPGTIPLLLRPVLSGKKSIWVDYRFQVQNARLTFSVEKAYYQDIRLPAFFVQKMIGIVAARQPEKYDTSKPLPLPFSLRQLSTVEHWIKGSN